MKVIQHSEIIWSITDFLSTKECDDYIVFTEMAGYEEATVGLNSGPKMIKSVRNNSRLRHDDPQLANKLWKKLADFCPEEIDGWRKEGLSEHFRFYKYDPSQRFKRHIDGRLKVNPDLESRITFMVYLNDDFEGGETSFDACTIKPKQGAALCFIHEQKHESLPILEGTKYVLRSDVLYARV